VSVPHWFFEDIRDDMSTAKRSSLARKHTWLVQWFIWWLLLHSYQVIRSTHYL